jgi:hypothetical protein
LPTLSSWTPSLALFSLRLFDPSSISSHDCFFLAPFSPQAQISL